MLSLFLYPQSLKAITGFIVKLVLNSLQTLEQKICVDRKRESDWGEQKVTSKRQLIFFFFYFYGERAGGCNVPLMFNVAAKTFNAVRGSSGWYGVGSRMIYHSHENQLLLLRWWLNIYKLFWWYAGGGAYTQAISHCFRFLFRSCKSRRICRYTHTNKTKQNKTKTGMFRYKYKQKKKRLWLLIAEAFGTA